MNQDCKVISVKTIDCHQWDDEGVPAILLVYDNGTVHVRCPGGGFCNPCSYGVAVEDV